MTARYHPFATAMLPLVRPIPLVDLASKDASFSPGVAASTALCVNCQQYGSAAGIFPTMTEWCSIGATNAMWLSITADCCVATPTRKNSWGRIKTIYRLGPEFRYLRIGPESRTVLRKLGR